MTELDRPAPLQAADALHAAAVAATSRDRAGGALQRLAEAAALYADARDRGRAPRAPSVHDGRPRTTCPACGLDLQYA